MSGSLCTFLLLSDTWSNSTCLLHCSADLSIALIKMSRNTGYQPDCGESRTPQVRTRIASAWLAPDGAYIQAIKTVLVPQPQTSNVHIIQAHLHRNNFCHFIGSVATKLSWGCPHTLPWVGHSGRSSYFAHTWHSKIPYSFLVIEKHGHLRHWNTEN